MISEVQKGGLNMPGIDSDLWFAQDRAGIHRTFTLSCKLSSNFKKHALSWLRGYNIFVDNLKDDDVIFDKFDVAEDTLFNQILLLDNAVSEDPFTSYLLWPHLHFSGTFRADVSTVNNNPLNFDTDRFTAADLIRDLENWNPKGSGEWSVTGSVTQVCYADGHCVEEDEGHKSSEPLIGAWIVDGGNKTLAKLVDFDPEAGFSEIWGWRISVGNLFSADYTPVPYQYLWKKMVTKRNDDYTHGAAYQSVLSNIRWHTSNDSRFIRELQNSMDNNNIIDGKRLSIRFNMDMYQEDYRKDNLTIGRITDKVKKNCKRYEAYDDRKTTETLLASKAIGMVVKVDDEEALQKDLT
ncbi:unnamed protein product [Porites evermanni]|uniref:Uncharacterized protein n=1 Tax=Porites evermanni TaxID=104178 RepID=A0ABN8Q4N6_9CNID|nr:unnamed protein product [Porites evermanni]